MKPGYNYEIFVKDMFDAIIKADNIVGQKNIKIEMHKKISDNCGVEREFDIYWEYEIAGITYKTVIECKDYNNTISVDKIDAFIGKLKDIPDLKGIFATRKGYQAGAKQKAITNKIDLLIVRELTNDDFTDKDGNPLLRAVQTNITILPSFKILDLNITLDKQYIQNNKIDEKQFLGKKIYDTEQTLIEDLSKNKTYLLIELLKDIINNCKHIPGIYEKSLCFDNAFITYQNKTKTKLKEIKIKYCISKPITTIFTIDAMNIFHGVIEYLSKNSKKFVSKDGKTKDIL
ncbi:restriction endonuclease [Candidatus Ruminimicrobiellum ovillum]|uniref:restriction endonuclease n=1 Tax=Candidatus Ruminimicrobiellum ovillum TaxID=1947927 RepID=UPI00355957ED